MTWVVVKIAMQIEKKSNLIFSKLTNPNSFNRLFTVSSNRFGARQFHS